MSTTVIPRKFLARFAWIILALAGVSAQAAPIVTVTTTTSDPTTLLVGQTATVTVSAVVSDPSGPNAGIFTFEQDLLLGNPAPLTAVLSVVSVSRPGVNDALLGGSDGIILLDQVQDIYGGYNPANTFGIGAPKVLYTATVLAVAPGTVQVVAGPNTTHYLEDLLLWDSSSPAVVYAAGPTFQVAVPEPGMLSLAAASALLLVRRRRRH